MEATRLCRKKGNTSTGTRQSLKIKDMADFRTLYQWVGGTGPAPVARSGVAGAGADSPVGDGGCE